MTDNIIIKDKAEFERKLAAIKDDGSTKLHIITDFDMTLTKPRSAHEKTNSTYALLDNEEYVSKDFIRKAGELYDYYRPIEISRKLSREEKSMKMAEWWQKYYHFILSSGLKKEHVQDVIRSDKLILRDKADDFLRMAKEKEIPLLIFSAGVGNIIEEFLSEKKEMYGNIHVISNFINFDENGNPSSHNKDLIHVYNKNETEIKNTPYHSQIEKRENVILLGDSLGDADMASGLKHKTVLRIAFLNSHEKNQEDLYLEKFDAVVKEGSFSFVEEIIKGL